MENPPSGQQSKLSYGHEIENRAQIWFLENFPARLIAKNYRCKVGEIDLVFEQTIEGATGLSEAQEFSELVFVEVRARAADSSWEDGLESVGFRKRRRLSLTIQHFLARYQGRAGSLRFDVMAWNGSTWSHFPNIWINA